MNKREYPLFLIDRSKQESYPYDFVVCLDREVGFVAKVIYFREQHAYTMFVSKFSKMENNELAGVHLPLKKGGVVLHVVDFLYHFEISEKIKSRVQVLLKKALKKYLNLERQLMPTLGKFGIDEQIEHQELTLELARQNYADLLKRSDNNSEFADYQIDLQKATIETLKNVRANTEVLLKLKNFN
ncbi:MAG: hypothetical protein LBB41_07335 [Prevotellaceae bacterium]|jgi:hypothetical protein|nr:hypothetical protein [Prevotellaceae bacterium]